MRTLRPSRSRSWSIAAATLAVAALVVGGAITWSAKYESTAHGAAVQAAHRAPAWPAWRNRPQLATTASERLPEQTVGLSPPLPDEVDICGVGRRKLTSDLLPTEISNRGRASILTLMGQRADSVDETERALGLTYRARINEAAAYREVVSAYQRNASNACDESAACLAEASAAGERAAVEDREALARLAGTTRDPIVYALAMVGCSSDAIAQPACGGLSTARWAQLDSDNGAPWYQIAAEAEARRDFLTRDQALHRIAQAKFIDFGHQRILGAAAAAERQAMNTAEWLGVTEWTIGVWAALPIPQYLGFTQACSADEVRDVNKRLLCQQVAEALVKHDPNPIGYATGVSVGQLAGWPSERIAQLEDEKDAVLASQQITWSDKPVFSCEWVETMREWSTQLAQAGELGAARARIKASGRSTSELAAEWREQRERARTGAAEAPGSPAPNPTK